MTLIPFDARLFFTMELVILGSGTAIPSPKRGSPGLLVKAADYFLLFDGGSGTLRTLAKAGISFAELDRVFYTHLHPDHTGDLVPLLFALRSPDYQRSKPLFIAGPKGFKAFFEKLQTAYGHWIDPMDYDLVLQELQEETVRGEGFQVIPAPVQHIKHSLAYRVEAEGRSLVFSGDTAYCEGIIELAKGADLLVLECSFPDERANPHHLTPSQAGEIAALAGCRRLVLTHFYPICDRCDILAQCRKTYNGEVTLAEDLIRVEV